MTWVFNGEIVNSPLDGHIGFVYLITDPNNKKYIGKKQFFFKKTIQKNKKKKRINVESDWKDYYGSSPILQEAIKELGKDFFKREILYFVKTKSEASYLEAKEQFIRDVLLDENYYNDWISVRITSRHLKNTDLRKKYVGTNKDSGIPSKI